MRAHLSFYFIISLPYCQPRWRQILLHPPVFCIIILLQNIQNCISLSLCYIIYLLYKFNRRIIMRKSNTKLYSNIKLFFYLLSSIIFFELVLNFATIKSSGLFLGFIKLLFIISISAMVCAVSALFKERFQSIFFSLILFILSFIYSSQIIYYSIFKTFYTFYSLLNSKQVFELKSTIFTYIINNLYCFFLNKFFKAFLTTVSFTLSIVCFGATVFMVSTLLVFEVSTLVFPGNKFPNASVA